MKVWRRSVPGNLSFLLNRVGCGVGAVSSSGAVAQNATPPLRVRKVLAYGDSLTAGLLSMKQNPDGTFSYSAYAHTLAAQLQDVQVHCTNRSDFVLGYCISSLCWLACIEIPDSWCSAADIGLSAFTTKQLVASIDQAVTTDVYGASFMGLQRQFAEQGPYDVVMIMACVPACFPFCHSARTRSHLCSALLCAALCCSVLQGHK